MSRTPEDLTASSGDDGVRIDAPRPPGSSGPVVSGPGPAAPPRRPRRSGAPPAGPVPAPQPSPSRGAGPGSSTGPATVAAAVPAERFEPAIDPIDVAPFDDELPAPRARRQRRTRASTSGRQTMAPRNERQFRQTVVKVDLWSVTKLSLCFYLSAMFVTLVALIALWVIADAAGIVGSIEKFLGELLSAEKGTFQFLSAEVLRGTILIGLVVVALQVVITVVGASFYNIFSELFGGLEITVKEEEAAPRI